MKSGAPRTLMPSALAAALIATAPLISADTAEAAPIEASILIDFGNDSSFRGVDTPVPDPNGNTWTSVWSGAFYPNLPATDGTPTAIDLGFDGAPGGTDYFNGPSGATEDPAATVYDASALGNLGVNEAVFDYYVNARFQIQGLDPTKTYNLVFYGSHKFNNDNTTEYAVYTDNTYTTLVDAAELEVGVNADHNQDTVATISGISPQTNNILYVEFKGANGGNGYLNALRIEVVPEPGTALLAGLGVLSLVRRRQH